MEIFPDAHWTLSAKPGMIHMVLGKPVRYWGGVLTALIVAWFCLAPSTLRADPVEPPTLEELLTIEQRVAGLIDKVSPAVVAVRIGAGSGSGVVVGTEGYVLTAAHVSGKPGQPCTILFPDGTRARGVSLGRNLGNDAGLIRIIDNGRWPHVELAPNRSVQPGDWVLALGHPQGFQPHRPVVARLGQVIQARPGTLQTDCTLIGGDSGGPLFDLQGRVVGIHSRIGGPTGHNFHAPATVFHQRWDELTRSVEIPQGFLGVSGVNHARGAEVRFVFPDTAAQAAGFLVGDVITTVDGQTIGSFRELAALVSERAAGDDVELRVLRNGRATTITATLGRRPPNPRR